MVKIYFFYLTSKSFLPSLDANLNQFNVPRWTQAMQLMVEGDKWELYIPSDLAYGDRGRPPQIPSRSALVFTLEIIKIKGEKVTAVAGDTELSATIPDNVTKMNSSISFSSFCIALIVVGIGGAAAAKVLKTSRRNKIASTGRPHR